MSQKLSLSVFFGSLTTFLGIAGEILQQHHSWAEFGTPIGVAHLSLLGASFVGVIGGALGITLPGKDK